MSHKDNENNIENGFIFMEKGKSMFHVKHFLDKYSENAKVVVPIAVEMNNNVFFQFMLIPHFLFLIILYLLMNWKIAFTK